MNFEDFFSFCALLLILVLTCMISTFVFDYIYDHTTCVWVNSQEKIVNEK